MLKQIVCTLQNAVNVFTSKLKLRTKTANKPPGGYEKDEGAAS